MSIAVIWLVAALGLAAAEALTGDMFLLMLSGGIQLAWDVAASRDGLLPAWNARVRSVMTVAGTLCSLALWPTIA